jgi:hypothetical protein
MSVKFYVFILHDLLNVDGQSLSVVCIVYVRFSRCESDSCK